MVCCAMVVHGLLCMYMRHVCGVVCGLCVSVHVCVQLDRARAVWEDNIEGREGFLPSC